MVTPRTDAAPTIPRAAALLRALTAPGDEALSSGLARGGVDEATARWLVRQGIAPHAFYRLRAAGLLDRLDPTPRGLLEQSYQTSALQEALRHQAATALLGALAGAGIEAVLLKGLALAHSVYPSPRCRAMGDLDLWVPAETYDAAERILTEQLGYQSLDKEERPAPLMRQFGGERQLRSAPPARLMVELQWPAIRGEWVRHTTRVDHEGIWQRRQPLAIDGIPVAVMAPEDTLVHLAIHQAINHQFTFPCWLRSLLDVHLVVRDREIAWPTLVERARAWQVATVCWSVLTLAVELLGTPVPPATLAALAPAPRRQALLARLELARSVVEMWPSEHDHRRLLVQALHTDHPADLLRLAGRALVPERAWLQARYGAESPAALLRARLLHPLRLLASARA